MKRMDPWWPLIAGCIAATVVWITGCGSVKTPAPYHTPNVSVSTPPATVTQVFTDPTGGKCDSTMVVNGYCPGDAPQYTASQQQAIDAATNYLSDGQGFSEAGLIQQLTSSYGNGFSQADAQFAVAHVQVDWNQQAAMSAKNYMSDGQGFSCSSLLDQLTSQYGGQFTQAQAEYGVQSVGLGTC